MNTQSSHVGNMNIELFIKNLFKLLDQQNNTNTKVVIKKIDTVQQ